MDATLVSVTNERDLKAVSGFLRFASWYFGISQFFLRYCSIWYCNVPLFLLRGFILGKSFLVIARPPSPSRNCNVVYLPCHTAFCSSIFVQAFFLPRYRSVRKGHCQFFALLKFSPFSFPVISGSSFSSTTDSHAVF